MRRADGGTACLLVSCVPVGDKTGNWAGTRGMCRDVTEMREREAALARARNRESLLGKIVNSIRNELDPARVLDAAAESTAQTLGAASCWILRRRDDRFEVAVPHDRGAGAVPAEAIRASLRAVAEADASPLTTALVDGLSVLIARARYHGTLNGAICIAREADAGPWDADQRALLAGVANHLDIAIAQITDRETLERISRTDELTGLLNRRAFFEEVGRRLSHLRRMGRGGALMYVDLDNFKLVNDVHGHEQGDAALKALSHIISTRSRSGDLAARLGGDEFALWLEEADEAAARAKANSLLSNYTALREHSGSEEKPLSISIGVR